MSQGRFSGLLLAALSLPLIFTFMSAAYAEDLCGPDEITLSSRADTVFVAHANSLESCCLELAIRVVVEGSIVEFYESDTGIPCRCICCYDYAYLASGFEAGHYEVFVYDETGSYLFGHGEVDVEGSSPPTRILAIVPGSCMDPQPVTETTWGRVRALYR